MKSTLTYTADIEIQLAGVTETLLHLISSTDEKKLNTVPFKNSWTIAQVADHITKSNTSIAKALQLQGTPISRSNTERVKELESIFLNFETKFQSPDFILPDKDRYKKDELVKDLQHSVTEIQLQAREAETGTTINHPAFGDITKIEILYFVLFHTQRHIQQLKNILSTLNHTSNGKTGI